MDYIVEKNSIVLFGKNEKLDTLATKLASLNGKQVYSMFINRGIAVPRKINCLALMSVINERLKTLHASELSKDYFIRLKYYNDFSEYQLYNLFTNICNTKEEFKQYRINLFKLILINFVGLNLADGEVNYLKNLKKLTMEKFETYFHYISSMCQEQENTFDGQDMNKLKDMLVNSASNKDILNLAAKYGLELTLSLKKQELAEVIRYYLAKAGELTKNLEVEIDALTVNGLNNLCKKYRIPMSSNMSKAELVNYLFYILDQCQILTTSVRRIETYDMFEPLEFVVDMSAFKGFKPDDTKRVILYRGFEHDEFPPLVKEEDSSMADNSDKPLNFDKEEKKADIEEEIKPEENAANSNESEAKDEEIQPNPKKKTSPKKKADAKPKAVIEEEIEEESLNMNVEPEAIANAEETDFEESDLEGEVIYVDEDGNPVDVEFEDDVEIIEEEIEEEALEALEDETFEEIIIEDDIAEDVSNPDEAEEVTEEITEEVSLEDIEPVKEVKTDAPRVEVKKLPKDDVRENKEYGNDKLMKAANGPGKAIALSILGTVGALVLVFVIWALLK